MLISGASADFRQEEMYLYENTKHMKNLNLLSLFMLVSFSILSCSNQIHEEEIVCKEEIERDYVQLKDGIYSTSVAADAPHIRRYKTRQYWGVNEEPILLRRDFSDISLSKEDNGYYSLYFDLTRRGEEKWDQVLASGEKSVAFVYNHTLFDIICINQVGSSDLVALSCISPVESDVITIKEHLLSKS